MEIYQGSKLRESELPELKVGKVVKIGNIKLEHSSTKPPPCLSESSLIDLMDQNGIGTDATIHEHIKKVQERGYGTYSLHLY